MLPKLENAESICLVVKSNASVWQEQHTPPRIFTFLTTHFLHWIRQLPIRYLMDASKLLRGKTVFMVTNQLQFLCRCDQILVLKADDNGEGIADSNRTGRIVEMGTYDSLMADGKAFCELMKKSGNDNKSKDRAKVTSFRRRILLSRTALY